jgi:hypothetical protein
MFRKIFLAIVLVLGVPMTVHSAINERLECIPQKAVATQPFMSGRYGTTHDVGDVLPLNFNEASNTVIDFSNNTSWNMRGSVRTGGPLPITIPTLSNNLYYFKYNIETGPVGSIRFLLDKDSRNLLAKYEYYDVFSACRKV